MNGLIRCAECGKLVSRGSEEMVFADGRFYCAECAEEALFECPHCGEMHVKANSVMVQTTDGFEEWCEDCADTDAFYCDHCDTYYPTDEFDSVEVDGNTWCEDCVSNDACYCEDCDSYHEEWNGTYVESVGRWVCDDCLRWNYTRCDDCEEYYPDDSLYETRNGEHVCRDCLEENYSYCEECEEYVPNDEYDDEHDMCYRCYEERCDSSSDADDDFRHSDNARVRGYHCAPPMVFFGDRLPSWNGRPHHWGLELEVDAPYENSAFMQRALNQLDELCGDHLYFEHDGSLNKGFEIIIHPHTETAFYEMPWERILKICADNGWQSHDVGTCGLHMHFSREIFGADEETQDDNIAKLVQFFELYYDDCVKVSRRTESQLRWAKKYGKVGKTQCKQLAKGKYGHHGVAVNMSNEHTVEIRIMRGTLNYETFMADVDFLSTIVKNSCRIGWSDTTDDIEWLVGLKPETRTHLRRRGAFLSALDELERNANFNEELNEMPF